VPLARQNDVACAGRGSLQSRLGAGCGRRAVLLCCDIVICAAGDAATTTTSTIQKSGLASRLFGTARLHIYGKHWMTWETSYIKRIFIL